VIASLAAAAVVAPTKTVRVVEEGDRNWFGSGIAEAGRVRRSTGGICTFPCLLDLAPWFSHSDRVRCSYRQ
jgi:hypothetical protein